MYAFVVVARICVEEEKWKSMKKARRARRRSRCVVPLLKRMKKPTPVSREAEVLEVLRMHQVRLKHHEARSEQINRLSLTATFSVHRSTVYSRWTVRRSVPELCDVCSETWTLPLRAARSFSATDAVLYLCRKRCTRSKA